MRTQYTAPCPLQKTLRCITRVTSRSMRPGTDVGVDGRVKVELSAELRAVHGDVVFASGECLFVAIADPEGKLSRHTPWFSPENIAANERAVEGDVGVVICEATTLVISAADHGIGAGDLFYAPYFTNAQRPSL